MDVAHRFCHCAEPDAPCQWNHTCSFYFDSHTTGKDDPIYLRIHASPEGSDFDGQIKTLHQVGAPEDWMARAFPKEERCSPTTRTTRRDRLQ
ncbi:hypothetical protein [Streptomyces sp. NPDC056468]|uniref:hypothetical protein n=1 Tax=Streptomyces sp. NPDC056468 TaxID=3345830 RepID=UPI00367A47CC